MEILNQFHIQLLHPKVIHFPIALFISAMGLEVMSLLLKKEDLHKTAVNIYILATIMVPFVVWTGLSEAAQLHLNHPILAAHKRFALLTMWGSLTSLPIFWFIKKKSHKAFRIIFLLATLIITVFVSYAGHNGGRMVYEYGVGIEK